MELLLVLGLVVIGVVAYLSWDLRRSARDERPAVGFFDELDPIGSRRDGGGGETNERREGGRS